MSVVKTAVNRPVTVLMITLGTLVFGWISLGKLPVNLLPDLSYPTLTLETKYPGAAPEEVEYLVTRPIEEAISVIPHKRISSSSKPEVSQVVIEFNWGQQMDFAILDVSKKVDLLRLPDDVEKPRILRYDPNQDPILKVSVTSTSLDLGALRYFCEEDLKKRFDNVSGLASVKVLGGEEEIVEIEMDEAALRRFGLTVDEVGARLRQENVNRAGGSLYENEARYLVRTMNEYKSLDEIASTIVASREGRNILLKEIADVRFGAKDREHIARINGTEGVELSFYKEGDANTVKVSQDLKKSVEEMAKRFEDTVKMTTTFEGASFIESSISEVKSNALIGGVIAILVLLFFLRDAKSTLVVALSIPISVFIAFFLMMQFGVSVNIMSLGGLALGIGMLVDNSIVVLESIFVQRQAGKTGLVAAEAGTTQVAGAVIASTLTTIVVFLPIVYITGVGGQLFKDLGLTVSFSLIASLVVALTLIPTLFGFLSKFWPTKIHETASDNPREIPRGFYPTVLGWALRHRFVVLAIVFLIVAQGGYVVKNMGMDLIPEMAQGDYYLLVEAEEGTPIEKTDEIAAWVESKITSQKGVHVVFTSVGQFNQGLEQRSGENLAQINFSVEKEQSAEILHNIRSEIVHRDDFSYQIGVPSYFSFRTPIEIEAKSDNPAELREMSEMLVNRMSALGGFKDIQTTVADGNPEVQVRFKRENMVQMGLSIGDVAQLLRDKIQGSTATRFVRSGRDLDIVVRLREQDRAELEQLQKLAIGYKDNKAIYLESVAAIETVIGPSQIKRVNQNRCAVITANLEGQSLSAAREKLSPIFAEMDQIYGSERVLPSGQMTEMDSSFTSIKFMILLAIFLVYLVMASQFESLLHPFLILLTVPIGLVGGMDALFLAKLDLSVVAMIGLVMLAGIVVNNAIVLIDYVNTLRREENVPLYEALMIAGARRLRPIMMTTSTTVLGLIPMALGLGDGAEMRMPLAVSVIGGLVFSTAITLVLIPVLYALVTPGLQIPDEAPALKAKEALS
ncbi:MAG: efflux RND transporter permease subunit [Acidobacteria bacterium]|nr:efflux RND transporter permease subunit [Acidobacteriota bacterium]MCB9399479.1 efflux RND transporter permease subunit [Acidobacteriota bacterium]